MAKAKYDATPNEEAAPTAAPFQRFVPNWGEGKSKVIGGQTAVFIPSPFPQFPGGVWVPYELSPAQYNGWHTAVMERVKRDADKRDMSPLDYWPERFGMFLEFELGNITPEQITKDWMSLPSMPLLSWLLAIGSELIFRATNFPNSPAPSNGGASGERERLGPPPPFPWAWHAAQWLYDPQLSAVAGGIRFRRPYPPQDWIEDMDWNEFPLAAMYHVTEADRVFSMPVDRWGAKEDAFFSAMLDGLTAAGFDY